MPGLSGVHIPTASSKMSVKTSQSKPKKKYGVTKKSVSTYGGHSDDDPLTKSGKQTTMTRQGKLPSGKKYMVSVTKSEEELHGGAKHKSSSSIQAAYSKDGSTVRTRPGIHTRKEGHKKAPNKYTEMKVIGRKIKPQAKKVHK